MKTKKKSFVITGTPSFIRGKNVEMNPVYNITLRQNMMAGLSSLYGFTNLDGAKGGCFCAAGNHLTVLIHFNH